MVPCESWRKSVMSSSTARIPNSSSSSRSSRSTVSTWENKTASSKTLRKIKEKLPGFHHKAKENCLFVIFIQQCTGHRWLKFCTDCTCVTSMYNFVFMNLSAWKIRTDLVQRPLKKMILSHRVARDEWPKKAFSPVLLIFLVLGNAACLEKRF